MESGGHGDFTKILLDGLDGAATDHSGQHYGSVSIRPCLARLRCMGADPSLQGAPR